MTMRHVGAMRSTSGSAVNATAQEQHDEQVHGEAHREVARAQHAHVRDVEPADAACHRATGHEREHAVLERVDGRRGGERLVVAHGVEGAAEAERGEAVVEQRDQREGAEPHPVKAGQRGDAEGSDLRLRDARHAERAAGEVDPVGGDDLGDDREAERAHGEAVLSEPEHRYGERQRDQPCRGDAGRQDGGERPARLGGQECDGVGADSEQRGVGERQAADVAHDQVVAQRERTVERGEDQHVEHVALLAGRDEGDEPGDRDERGGDDGPAPGPHRQIPMRRPNSPCGRTSSTATITTNAMASL